METPFDNLRNSSLGCVLSSCEPELQELMMQVDIMIDQKKQEWQDETLALEFRLRNTEEELRASRERCQRRDLEVQLLRSQLEEVTAGRQGLVLKNEQQQHELDKLRRSYLRLQQKQMKYAATVANTKELSELSQRIEEYEQKCTNYANQLQTIEAQNKSLVGELQQVNLQFETFQKARVESERCPELQYLEAQLASAQDHLHLQEQELERLRPLEAPSLEKETIEDAVCKRSSPEPERSDELNRLRQENEKLAYQLQAKEEVIRTMEYNVTANEQIVVTDLRKELERAIATIFCAQGCERDMKAEAMRLRDKLDQQRVEQSKTEVQLKEAIERNEPLVAEVNKLREEILRARQIHSGEVGVMRIALLKLTADLRQRDHTISSLTTSTSRFTKQLPQERERSEPKKAQTTATEEQLDSLKTENQRLQRPERHSSKRADPVMSLSSNLKQDNQQPRTEPTKGRRAAETSYQAGGDIRRMLGTMSLEDIQLLANSRPPDHSDEDLNRRTSQLDVAQGPSSDCAPEKTTRKKVFTSPQRSESPSRLMVSRFLDQESLHARQLLQKFDSHIKAMRQSNPRTTAAEHQPKESDSD